MEFVSSTTIQRLGERLKAEARQLTVPHLQLRTGVLKLVGAPRGMRHDQPAPRLPDYGSL